ncbi:MAG: hypothetical protein J6J36_05825 [Clostridia bacterium]|nr:hypothetical protein [Clostridia bacterium]
MSENNKNLHRSTDSYGFGKLEDLFNGVNLADSIKKFEVPLQNLNIDSDSTSNMHVDVDCSTAFANSMGKVVTSAIKDVLSPNCALSETFEFYDCVRSCIDPISEAEDILTPLFQSKAKELCPSDDMLVTLTMSDVVHLMAEDCCDGDCDNCECSESCEDDCCSGDCECSENCEDDCCGGDCGCGDCCGNDCDDCERDDCECSNCCEGDCESCAADTEESDDEGILDPDAPLNVKASIVCTFLFGEYATYEQLPDEMKKAVDLAREAYAIIVGESLSKLQSILLHHFNDIPTSIVSDYFFEIAGRASYTLTLLDIIDPDHRANNFPEDSDNSAGDSADNNAEASADNKSSEE